jgi:anhydro-N-acetylmuramic acid kinase
MKKDCYNVIGVMSGTSLDGVDLANIKFRLENQKWSLAIAKAGLTN